jgi:methionine synthase II (cobalamin-independent)
MTAETKAPYHFDQVGSFLRSKNLKEARAKFAAGEISHDDLLKVQKEEVSKIVEHQHEAGLHDLTDGEYGRSWWHLDFLWNLNGVDKYDYEESYKFHVGDTKQATRTDNVEITGKVSSNLDHPFFEDFKYLLSILPEDSEAKATIPSPSLLFRDNRSDKALDFYDSWEDYLNDLAKAYHDTLQHYYDLGGRYVQLDDTTWAYLIAQFHNFEGNKEELAKFEKIANDSVYVINKALEDLPEELIITTHICRGNFKSTYLFEGSYDSVAPYLGQLNYDGFFLEYDDERSGDFEALSGIYNNRDNVKIVLGLVTSKDPKLESAEFIKSRIQQATQYVPLENLALSTQCGFASTEEGNKLTEDEQWNKLKFVGQIANEVWG